MAGIVQRGGLGVKRKGLQDIVVGLRLWIFERKMTGNEFVYKAMRTARGGRYGECGIQFWRGQAGDAEFGRVEIEIPADFDCDSRFHFADGVYYFDSHGARRRVNAFWESDGRCFARGDSFDQPVEVCDEDVDSNAIQEGKRERAIEGRTDVVAGYVLAISTG